MHTLQLCIRPSIIAAYLQPTDQFIDGPLPMFVPCPLAVTTACCLDKLCVSYVKLRCNKPSRCCVEAHSIGWCAIDTAWCVSN